MNEWLPKAFKYDFPIIVLKVQKLPFLEMESIKKKIDELAWSAIFLQEKIYANLMTMGFQRIF